jgi:hypothetical protein
MARVGSCAEEVPTIAPIANNAETNKTINNMFLRFNMLDLQRTQAFACLRVAERPELLVVLLPVEPIEQHNNQEAASEDAKGEECG